MKVIGSLFVMFILSASVLFGQLPNGPNVFHAWYQDEMKGLRVFYGYSSPEPDNTHCRIDYYHDGRIKLLAVQGFRGVADSQVSEISTWYSLIQALNPNAKGFELRMTSAQTMAGSGIEVKPIILTEDLFTKFCVPRLEALFEQIPEPEVKMWKEQYGELFGLE